eukprot:5746676-Pleurochrysis_carterae.AAC.1
MGGEAHTPLTRSYRAGCSRATLFFRHANAWSTTALVPARTLLETVRVTTNASFDGDNDVNAGVRSRRRSARSSCRECNSSPGRWRSWRSAGTTRRKLKRDHAQ